MGFEPGVAYAQAAVMRLWTDTFVKPPCLMGNVGRAPSLHYTLAFALQLRKKHGKNSVSVAEKRQDGQRWARDLATILRASSAGL
jgi:hypothetical protein